MSRFEEAILGEAPFNSKISNALSFSPIAAKCSALKSHWMQLLLDTSETN